MNYYLVNFFLDTNSISVTCKRWTNENTTTTPFQTVTATDASPKNTYQSTVEEDNNDERVSTSRTTFFHATSTEMPEGSVVGYDSW